MSVSRVAGLLTIASFAFVLGGSNVVAQQAGYFGYASSQSPSVPTSPGVPCGMTPPTGCTVVFYGCTVTVCDYKCPPSTPIPPGGTCPTVTVTNEGPPTQNTVNIDIYRNFYVPYYVNCVPGADVTAANINVKNREIHFLSDSNGKPLTPQQVQELLLKLQQQASAGASPPPAPSPSMAPPAPPMPKAGASVDPKPSENGATVASSPKKQWIMVTNMNKYGYGYITPQGFAVIDEGSYRDSLPTEPASSRTSEVASTSK